MIINIINNINNVLWNNLLLYLLIFLGLFLSISTKFLQIRKFPQIIKTTLGNTFKKISVPKENNAISPFSALSTALASTIGTGNIVGVATAIFSGGAGAVFWMWISALLGMVTIFFENSLGIIFRKNKDNHICGGTMYYIENSFKNKGFSKFLAVWFSVICVLTSIGMGNMVQVNSICSAVPDVDEHIISIIIAVFVIIITAGGIKSISKFSSVAIPVSSVIYIGFSAFACLINYRNIIPAFKCIFQNAFGFQEIAGGINGYIIKNAVNYGFRRGIFSNEAGLGTAPLVHSNSTEKNPFIQGFWGAFQVFFDTIIICTVTATVILTSGEIDFKTGFTQNNLNGVLLVNKAFSSALGNFSVYFISASMICFAFTTVIGWSCYGETAWEYLFGKKSILIYRILFVLLIIFGATKNIELVWGLADLCNGFMALPNIIAVTKLSPVVLKALNENKNFLTDLKN